MQRVNFSNPRLVINFFWNLSIDLTILYGFVYLDPFQLEPLGKTCAVSKPMFGYLVKMNAQFVYPFIFVINISYSQFFNSQIIHLLDSDLFYAFYSRDNKWRSILVCFIGGHFFLCFMFFFDKINFQQIDTKQLICYSCLYSSMFQYWVLGIYNYSQYATFKLFSEYEKRLSNVEKMTVQEQFGIIDQIRSLADINFNLTQCLSIPILFFIILNIFNIIMFLSMAILCKPSLGLIIHVFTSALYLILIIILNHKLLLSLKRITIALQRSQLIKHSKQRHPLSSNFKLTGLAKIQHPEGAFVISTTLHSSAIQRQLREPIESRQIQYVQLEDIYSKYFHIKIFRLITLNFNYLLKVSLFILSYIVLISQTTM